VANKTGIYIWRTGSNLKIAFCRVRYDESNASNYMAVSSIAVGKISFIWIAKRVDAPGYFFIKNSISLLLFELFQI
jgi:hypothetical protein